MSEAGKDPFRKDSPKGSEKDFLEAERRERERKQFSEKDFLEADRRAEDAKMAARDKQGLADKHAIDAEIAGKDRQYLAQEEADRRAKRLGKNPIIKTYPEAPAPLIAEPYAPTYRPGQEPQIMAGQINKDIPSLKDIGGAKDKSNPGIQLPRLKTPRPPVKP